MNLYAVLNSFVRQPTTDSSTERKFKMFMPYVIQVKNREEILSEFKTINISLIYPHTTVHPLHDTAL